MERAHREHQSGLRARHSIILPGSKDPGNQGFTCHEVELNGIHLFYGSNVAAATALVKINKI